MSLIKRLINFIFRKRVDDSEPKPKPPSKEELLQRKEDRKWEIRIKRKATQRFYELHLRKSGVPVLDMTRYTDSYIVFHPETAKYVDGIEKAIQRTLSEMLAKKDSVPKGTIPRV